MGTPASVLGALRRFIPELLQTAPALSAHQHRAIWAITHCRTPALGGRVFACKTCGHRHLAYHSCNHKACPQCGAHAAHRWVQREQARLINAPYFLVTFTLPAELRPCFLASRAKEAYDLFFAAASGALREKLAADKALRAHVNGFVAVLHTWTWRWGKCRRNCCFLTRTNWPRALSPSGSGASALKYLGAYVTRTAITDARLLRVDSHSVTFRWKDRSDRNRIKELTLPGVDFVRRYLRHVLPTGLRSVRHYGFCHPKAQASRWRVQLHSGRSVQFGHPATPLPAPAAACPPCPRCGQPTQLIFSVSLYRPNRGPPPLRRSQRSLAFAA